MQKVDLAQDIDWVGAVDWNLRNFFAGAFGLYGWGRDTIRAVDQVLQQGEMKATKKDLTIKYRLQPEERLRCQVGLDLAQRIKQGL